jgi:hypothetical protein
MKKNISGNIDIYKEFDASKLFDSDSYIINHFQKIWKRIIRATKLDTSAKKALSLIKNLVIYDILDGNRSTLISNSIVSYEYESTFYTLNFLHILRTLGAKKCYIMIHTRYNRERGQNEVDCIFEKISAGAPLIKKFSIENNIRCFCIGMSRNYEYNDLLENLMDSTKNGNFKVYFLIDYNELWFLKKEAQNIFKDMPNVDVYIRHTKFQPSGGWIPDKMSHSVFLYSQNGTLYSNWKTEELVTLVALALIAKLFHSGELLKKRYRTKNEIKQRNELREIRLTNNVIYLRKKPNKLFILGSPIGIYQFYF